MSSADLSSYQLQLEQVKAALTSDPANEELLKLQTDLEQVISLTQELIQAQLDTAGLSQTEAADPPSQAASADPARSGRSRLVEDLTPVKHWQVGEQCQALWHKDGLYYEATINEITTEGEVSVSFKHTGQPGLTSLGLLQFSKLGVTGTQSSLNKKEQISQQKEYLKKKKQKKVERLKTMEKEREKEKTKWQSFSHKAFGKRGFVKKSIFKTPENASGRVGVGTCGVSGQEMTKFSHGSKYRKGV